MRVITFLSLCAFVAGVPTDDVSVIEGKSVTLQTGFKVNIGSRHLRIKWYFKGTRIAQTIGSLKKICTDDHCEERFRDRLKLDSHTGDLTITNTRTTDSGHYKLHIFIRQNNIQKIFNVAIHGVSGVSTDEVSAFVMEGDAVTLHTVVEMNQQNRIKWYFNDIRIAQITGDQRKICTDVQCNEGTERFRDRLKLDHQTGSLTITNTRNTDTGEYKLQIISSRIREVSFSIFVHGVSAAERDEMKRKSVKEGESVTLDPGVINPNDVMMWRLNDILITEINGDQSYICTDDQCTYADGRFKDQLELDHQTGSLTITNTRIEHSGDYHLQIINRRFKIIRSFAVIVTGSALSSSTVTGIQYVLLFCCTWLPLLV